MVRSTLSPPPQHSRNQMRPRIHNIESHNQLLLVVYASIVAGLRALYIQLYIWNAGISIPCLCALPGTIEMAGSLRRRSAERPCTLLQGIPNPLASSHDTLTDASGVWAGGGVTTANLLVCMPAHICTRHTHS